MKYNFFLILFIFALSEGNSQTTDTIVPSKNLVTIPYKQFIVPSSLILSGFLLKNTNINLTLQNDIRNFLAITFKPKPMISSHLYLLLKFMQENIWDTSPKMISSIKPSILQLLMLLHKELLRR